MNKIEKGVAYFQKYGLAATIHRIFVNDYKIFSRLPPEKYEDALKKWYKRRTGNDLDLENPKTFNEKIQWMKLYDSTPLKTRLADKYLVRDWVKEKIGEEYLIPLLGVWDDFDEIDFNKLPDQFVLKANHGSGWNIIVKDKSKLDINDARKKFNKWMRTNFAFAVGLELQYLNIPPRIIAEQYFNNANRDLNDYKFFCFGGKAEFILLMADRSSGVHAAYYDVNWNRLPAKESYPPIEKEMPKPDKLELMTGLAEKLSEGFAHARVDFYVFDNGDVKFGEITFTSGSGTAPWVSQEVDRAVGDLICLPEEKGQMPQRMKLERT